jgi:hypothetical protein
MSKYGTVLYYAGKIPLLNLSLCGAASASYVKVVILYMVYLKRCSICLEKVGAVVQYNKVQKYGTYIVMAKALFRRLPDLAYQVV